MSFDELEGLGVPEAYRKGLEEHMPDVFRGTPFFTNHVQLIDAITAALIAWDRLLQHTDIVSGKELREELYNVSFKGASGNVSFTPFVGTTGGDRVETIYAISQAVDSKAEFLVNVLPLPYNCDSSQCFKWRFADSTIVPNFPDGKRDPRNYDSPLHCGQDQRLAFVNGREACAPCPFVLAGSCVPVPALIGFLAVPVVVFLFILYGWVWKSRLNDTFWLVKLGDLEFSDPPEKLGEGTFGYVVKATYRGTEVAVKRVIPPIKKLRNFHMYDLFGPGYPGLAELMAKDITRTRSLLPPLPYQAEKGERIKSWDSSMFGNNSGGQEGKQRSSRSGNGGVGMGEGTIGKARGASGRSPCSCGEDDYGACNEEESAEESEDAMQTHSRLEEGLGVTSVDCLGALTGCSPASSSSSEPTSESGDSTDDKLKSSSHRSKSSSNKSGPKATKTLTPQWRSLDPTSMFRLLWAGSANGRRNLLQKEFIQEMRTLSRLRHPCIVTVMGAVISDRVEPMLVMEYMDNGSLRSLLQNDTLPLDELSLPMLKDVGQGMCFLHSSVPVIIHSDLKSSNVLVDARFRAKIADFGLSRRSRVHRLICGPAGTPPFMAPELLRGGLNSCESDVYAFGVLLYEVQTRREPYDGERLEDVLAEVSKQASETGRLKRPSIPSSTPAEMAVLMRDCWHEDPALRPHFEEVCRRLETLAESGFIGIVERRRRINDLLYDVFPRHIAEALRDGRKVEPEHHDVVTIFFSDIVGFTDISSTLPAHKVSAMLDRLYSQFDSLSSSLGVFKVETIGDAYMGVCNLVEDQSFNHARRISLFAAQAIEAARSTLIDSDDPSRGCVNIRVGFHSGPVVANVVGTRNPRYCLFGDTVNTASRMESNSERNRIHCSGAAAAFVRRQAPEVTLVSRGHIPIKGKGEMETYWVEVPPTMAASPVRRVRVVG
mmetsp:Transcript_29576/g.62857  ORF Transcript_29576/g.62857 Transcript_29576/m.62857 type:complete len:940 (+) Transcript_29576:1-2820(+)